MSDTTSSTTTPGGADPQATFVQMSALLTGFAAGTIAPSLDPVDLAATLFQAAREGSEPTGSEKGNSFDALLAQYAELSGGKPVSEMTPEESQDVGNQLLGLGGTTQDHRLAETAQSVMRLWYLGYWYPVEGGGEGSVVSDQAYIRGLAWKVMQSHAMGYSPWSYGYWKNEPPPLSDFTGNPEPSIPAMAAAPAAAAGVGRRAPAAAVGRRAPSALGQGKGGQSPASLSGEDHAADQSAEQKDDRTGGGA